ncbi:MAG: N-acetyltransferase [Candidatus Marinimicrobia bacterium]|nr:N-acetyltransferase [Candidatus Neomarinimicrobiota bacterium]
MSDFSVRDATREDILEIVRFNAAMARETEDLDLEPIKLKEGVQAVFEDPLKGFYLVVEHAGKARACLMITTEWSDWRNGHFWWIQSVYVEKEYRNQGLFKALYRYLLDRVESNSAIAGLRLYVEKENILAQQTYEKLGMHKTDYFLYEYSKTKV